MADTPKEQVQTALQILLNASSQARLTAGEHDQVRQAAQILAQELGLGDGSQQGDAPEIEMPEVVEG
jgi:hypothetical protein|tara:strand:+ start:199 stop:399 length:201 start_codon:yes stop_codon:yes gene_type:complete